MLLEFSVENFLSFRNRKTLSLEATAIKDYAETNLIYTSRVNLLTGALIYGANSSGKTNLIKAMSTMRRLVLNTFNNSSVASLDIEPFLLQKENLDKPSFFEVAFIINEIRYRYGFEINNTAVVSEWLFETRKEKENPLFIRQGDGIEVMKGFDEGKGLEERTRDNVLFLSVVDQFNGDISVKIIKWFARFFVISGLSHERYKEITYRLLENENTRPLLQEFFNSGDLGFDGFNLDKKTFELPAHASKNDHINETVRAALENQLYYPKTIHKVYDEEKNVVATVEFEMDSQESAGTNKIYNISGAIFEVLRGGGVLVIDELDASLHPLLTLAITNLFNSKNHNVKGAQLIFATHDTNLLTYGKYRRDQIYFVEKDKYGGSDLYSLVEYREEVSSKPIRNDRSFEKDYIQGRYGAIPFIGDFQKIVTSWQE